MIRGKLGLLFALCFLATRLATAGTDTLLPPFCLHDPVDLIAPISTPCESGGPPILERRMATSIVEFTKDFRDQNWLVRRHAQLAGMLRLEINRTARLHRYLADGQSGNLAVGTEPEIAYQKYRADFGLLFELTNEIEITRRKIGILEHDKIGYIAPDLYDKLKKLQSMKVLLLEKSPLLGGETLEALIKKGAEKETPPSEADFRKAFVADLSRYLALQGESLARHEKPDPSNLKRDLREILESGLANDDFSSSDIATQGAACSLLKRHLAFERNDEIKRDVIDGALLIAPFFFGELGLVSRALAASRWVRWGLSAERSAKVVPRVLTGGTATAVVGWNVKELNEFRDRCRDKFLIYNTHPTEGAYEGLQTCREESSQRLFLMAAGFGASGASLAFKALTPAIRAGIQDSLTAGLPAGSVKSGFMGQVSQDLGLGKIRKIQVEVEGIQTTVRAHKGDFSSLSPSVVSKSEDVRSFVTRQSLSSEVAGHRVIPSDKLGEYMKSVGQDTAEILYVPGAPIPTLPEQVRRVGHIAIRVGDKVYHQTGRSGFQVETLESFIHSTKKDLKVFGTVIEISPREKETMKYFFAHLKEKQIPYSLLFNNCSQTLCKALEHAEIEQISGLARLDPLLTAKMIRRSDRVVMSTVYNSDKDLTAVELSRANTKSRLALYGVPSAAGVGTGGLTYGGVLAVDKVLDWIEDSR